MEAVLFATGHLEGLEAVQESYPAHLVPLVDRPFVQVALEMLIEQGVERVHIVLSHLPGHVEAALGDGTQWGCDLSYHTVPDPLRPYDLLRALFSSGPTRPVLLAHADTLVKAPPATDSGPVFFYESHSDGKRHWTGWARLPSAWLRDIPPGAGRDTLEQTLIRRSHRGGCVTEVSAMRRAPNLSSLSSWFDAQWDVLEGRVEASMLWGRQVEDGVRVGSKVTLKSGVVLRPPVFIGEGACIGPNTTIGPRAVVGAGSVVGGDSLVEDTVVFPDSYVGVGVCLQGAVVDRGRLISLETGESVPTGRGFLLGDMALPSLQTVAQRLVGRFTAALLLLVCLPLLLVVGLAARIVRRAPVWHSHRRLKLPASPDPATWEVYPLYSLDVSPFGSLDSWFYQLWGQKIPQLLNILRGDIDWFGVSPRRMAQVLSLPEQWRSLYLTARGGLLTEAWAKHGLRARPDQQWAYESFYATRRGLLHDLHILGAAAARGGSGIRAAFGRSDPSVGSQRSGLEAHGRPT